MTKQGKQTELSTRWDLLPPDAMYQVAKVLHEGAIKYDNGGDVTNGNENWRLIYPCDHINHTLEHLFRYLAQDETMSSTEELSHAACRILFALDLLTNPMESLIP